MSSINTSTSALRGEGSSIAVGIKQGENQNTYSGPKRIVSIKPQRTDVLGDNPKKFNLVVESRNGETLKEAKWDPIRKGWHVGIVQIRGSFKTENLDIKLRKEQGLGLYRSTIASGQLTLKDVDAAIHESHNELEISLVVQSQNVSRVNAKRLALIVEIDTPSLLPVWITSIR
ncbi:hypothetical protein V5O48_014288, partial [Marasmius crinis-equi]